MFQCALEIPPCHFYVDFRGLCDFGEIVLSGYWVWVALKFFWVSVEVFYARIVRMELEFGLVERHTYALIHLFCSSSHGIEQCIRAESV